MNRNQPCQDCNENDVALCDTCDEEGTAWYGVCSHCGDEENLDERSALKYRECWSCRDYFDAVEERERLDHESTHGPVWYDAG